MRLKWGSAYEAKSKFRLPLPFLWLARVLPTSSRICEMSQLFIFCKLIWFLLPALIPLGRRKASPWTDILKAHPPPGWCYSQDFSFETLTRKPWTLFRSALPLVISNDNTGTGGLLKRDVETEKVERPLKMKRTHALNNLDSKYYPDTFLPLPPSRIAYLIWPFLKYQIGGFHWVDTVKG